MSIGGLVVDIKVADGTFCIDGKVPELRSWRSFEAVMEAML
jgi:hypothetical protein